MRVAVFSAKPYDRDFFCAANEGRGHDLSFHESRLDAKSAPLAEGADAVCAFVNDSMDRDALEALKERGVKLIALRCAGFNNVDLKAAEELGIKVGRVPAYSPNAVAEHTLALILTLNRKTHRAYNRVREGNFSLTGLVGFDLCGKTVGLVGTGKIGTAAARIFRGFSCEAIAADPYPSDECRDMGVRYMDLPELLEKSDIVSLHLPLTPDTEHMIDAQALDHLKDGAMLINTSRGALIDTKAVIGALKSGTIGALGLDVYEEESDLFFQDLSGRVIQDDVFARLLTFPNVLITGHQGFFTREALENIAETTMENIDAFDKKGEPGCPVTSDKMA